MLIPLFFSMLIHIAACIWSRPVNIGRCDDAPYSISVEYPRIHADDLESPPYLKGSISFKIVVHEDLRDPTLRLTYHRALFNNRKPEYNLRELLGVTGPLKKGEYWTRIQADDWFVNESLYIAARNGATKKNIVFEFFQDGKRIGCDISPRE